MQLDLKGMFIKKDRDQSATPFEPKALVDKVPYEQIRIVSASLPAGTHVMLL